MLHFPREALRISEVLWWQRGKPRRRPIQEIPENSFWGSQMGTLGWFSLVDENVQSWHVGHGGSLSQKTREGCGSPKSFAGKVSGKFFDAARKLFTDFPAAWHAIPAKVWAFSGKESPKDPAVLKTLRDTELLRRSVLTTPPRFTTPWTLLWEENFCNSKENGVRTRCAAIANHALRDSKCTT